MPSIVTFVEMFELPKNRDIIPLGGSEAAACTKRALASDRILFTVNTLTSWMKFTRSESCNTESSSSSSADSGGSGKTPSARLYKQEYRFATPIFCFK
jgi:hypothetical protein